MSGLAGLRAVEMLRLASNHVTDSGLKELAALKGQTQTTLSQAASRSGDQANSG